MTAGITLLGGEQTPNLLRVAARVVEAAPPPVAVIGGLAVTCWLTYAHRATVDVDTVVEERSPSVVELLTDLDGAEASDPRSDRVILDGVIVDVIGTVEVGDVELPDGTPELFVLGHRYALESAVLCAITLVRPEELEVVLPIASPAGLIATKLCSIQGMRHRPEAKRATDGYDLYRLLSDLDADGAVSDAISRSDDRLVRCVRSAAEELLIRGATRVVRLIESNGVSEVPVTVDELSFVAERFVDQLPSQR